MSRWCSSDSDCLTMTDTNEEEDTEENPAYIYENEKLEMLIRGMRLCKTATFYVDTFSNDDMRLIADELRTNRRWNTLRVIGHNKIDLDGAKYLFDALTANPA
ncbi:unnamed protein product, partial [Didymodactylos carnosus]